MQEYSLKHVASLAFALLFLAAISAEPALADLIETNGTVATIHGDPDNSGGQSTGIAAQVGTGGGGGIGDNIGLAGIFFFQMPDLSATPQIDLAELTVLLTGGRDAGPGQVPDGYSVDLYMLDPQSNLTMTTPMHYGDGGQLPASAMLIQADWWTAGDDSQIGTDKTIDVTAFLASLYTDGTPNDTYAVFALYATDDLPDIYDGTYFFEDSTIHPDGPLLAITANVPEPTSITFLGLCCGLLMTRRGQRK